MYKLLFLILTLSIALSSCIGDDFVNDFQEANVSITSNISSIELGTDFQLTARYLNNVGVEELVPKNWSSSDTNIAIVDNNGLVSALVKGKTTIKVSVITDDNIEISDETTIDITDTTTTISDVVSGFIKSTSGYQLEGNFTLSENENGLELSFEDNYIASDRLPGLYVYLTNNVNTNANALEIAEVVNFSGAHSYTIPNVGINDYDFILYYCKPFSVKVGDGQIGR